MFKSRSGKPFMVIDIIIWLVLFVLMFSDIVAGWYVKEYINKSNDFKVKTVKVNIFTGNLFASRLTGQFLDSLSGTTYQCSIPAVRISGISARDIISGKTTSIGTVTLINPWIYIHADSTSMDSLYQGKESNVDGRLSSVKKIRLLDGFVIYKDLDGDSLTAEIERIDIEKFIPGFVKQKVDPCSKLNFQTGAVTYFPSKQLYRFSLAAANSNADGKIIMIDSLKVTPLHSKSKFDDKAGDQTDRLDLKFAFTQIIFPANIVSLPDSFLQACVVFSDGKMEVYRDKRMPRQPGKIKKTVQEYLEQIDSKIIIDSLCLRNIDVSYQEHEVKADNAGEVNFKNIDATIYNIRTSENNKGKIELKAHSTFMQSGRINAELEFPYGDKHFFCKGTVTRLPVKELNKISENNASLVFSGGTINSLAFNFRGDADSSKGDLLLLYEGLEFAVADKKSGDTTSLRSKINSFIASEILIPSENPKKDKEPEKGKIEFARDREKFVFNYIFKSILSGIIDTVSPVKTDKKGKAEKKEKRRRK